jgi:hypothetical protein
MFELILPFASESETTAAFFFRIFLATTISSSELDSVSESFLLRGDSSLGIVTNSAASAEFFLFAVTFFLGTAFFAFGFGPPKFNNLIIGVL